MIAVASHERNDVVGILTIHIDRLSEGLEFYILRRLKLSVMSRRNPEQQSQHEPSILPASLLLIDRKDGYDSI